VKKPTVKQKVAAFNKTIGAISRGDFEVKSKKTLPPGMEPLPRKPIVEKMCESCPFGPNRGGPKLTVSDDDLASFKQTAIVSEFYCHETVLMDARTKTDPNTGDAIGIQPHFRVCRGGWELKLKTMRNR